MAKGRLGQTKNRSKLGKAFSHHILSGRDTKILKETNYIIKRSLGLLVYLTK